jgi:hypothetical protein
MFMIVPNNGNQPFNPAFYFSNNADQFFMEAVGMSPSNFCMKFIHWATSQNGVCQREK